MHGRKKVPISEAKRIEQIQKAKKLGMLCENAFDSIHDPAKLDDFIKGQLPILDYVDDYGTIWNRRKEYFLKIGPSLETLNAELELTMRVIYKNPKSYFGFHHRRWCIEHVPEYDCKAEIVHCDKLIQADNRNFHAWRHRRWAIARIKAANPEKTDELIQSEFNTTTNLIQSDSGNYSAWHYRSQIPISDYENEIELAKSAFWTDPLDQSPWIYYRWLLNRPEISSNEELLQSELEQMYELCNEEPKAKYPPLACIWILKLLPNDQKQKIDELKEKLIALDPIRAAYYKEQ